MRPDDGFNGCLFGAQFDNVHPLESVFQDFPRPDYIYVEPENIMPCCM